MTVMYTPYTSIEDAWGKDFSNDYKAEKKKKSKKTDPLCDLYSKRYKKIRKPFYAKDSDMMENDYFNKVHSFKGEKDTNMYNGYKDDDFTRLVNEERQQTNNMIIGEEGQCVDTYATAKYKKKSKKAKKSVKFQIEPEDEDDLYLQQAVSIDEEEDDDSGSRQNFDDIINTNQGSFDRIYSNVYDETDDELVEEELSDVKEESCSKSLSQLIEDEINKNTHLKSLQKRSNTISVVDERQYLDLLMYIFSGIILIFIMEQFIQIGIRMKTVSY